jgi:hypothetical protein
MNSTNLINLKATQLCHACGYDLRGLDSYRCPECGREFDPDWAVPQAVIHLFDPVFWPAKMAKLGAVLLLSAEAIFLPPLWLALCAWLLVFVAIGNSYYRLVIKRRSAIKRHHLPTLSIEGEPAMRWRARKWFAASLVLTLLSAPQFLIIAVELPWLNYKAQHMYEAEPLLAPHSTWNWCVVHPVSNLSVQPSGVYFDLGLTSLSYSDAPSYEFRRRNWQQLVGRWWRESNDLFVNY